VRSFGPAIDRCSCCAHSETLKDKIIDKGADAGIAGAQEKWRSRNDEDPGGAGPAS